MKKTLMIAVLGLALTGCSHVVKQAGTADVVNEGQQGGSEVRREATVEVAGRFVKGEQAPAVTVESFEGERVDLSGFYGNKAIVIDFWAGWCPFCVEEMPELQKAQDKYKDELLVVGVHRTDTEPVETGKKFADGRGVSYLLVKDVDGSMYRAGGGVGMPVAVYIDKSGVVREIKSGPKTAEEIEEKVEGLL